MVETPKAQTEVKPADLSWIEAGEGGWVAKTLEACMAQQTNVLVKFSEDEKKAGNNTYGNGPQSEYRGRTESQFKDPRIPIPK